MGTIVIKNQPCKRCPSSDAVQVYEDGWAHCFSCNSHYRWEATAEEQSPKEYGKKQTLDSIKELPVRGFKVRGITSAVAARYGVRCEVDDKGEPFKYFFPTFANGEVVGYKVKTVNRKDLTYSIDSVDELFGNQLLPSGGKRVIITEGEEDAMAVAQVSQLYYKTEYPVVSMGASTNTKVLLKYRDTLRNFDEIILWFDQDEPGQAAVVKAAKILGYEKIKVVKSDVKDACDKWKQLEFSADRLTEFMRLIWDAPQYSPASIVRSSDTWDKLDEFLNSKFIPWPSFLRELNQKTFGRALGTISLLIAGTGVGKSSLLREDIYHLWSTTDKKIGVCFLEEDIGETVAGIISLHLNDRIALPTSKTTAEQRRKAWEEVMGDDRIMLIDHQGAVSDGTLLDKLEYLILCGCHFIYLDHITIAVSESEEKDPNKAIDQMMGGFLKLVKRHKHVWMGIVSHLRKVKSGEESFEKGAEISEDDIKGSGSLKQITWQTIAISRNKNAEDDTERHTSKLFLLKDRKTGSTGPAGAYMFDGATGRLKEATNYTPMEMEIIR